MTILSTKQLNLINTQILTMLSGMGVKLDSDERGDLDTLLIDFLEDTCDISIEGDMEPQPPKLWCDDAIQFPRLIAEINANFRLNGEELNDMLESMSITSSQLDELFNRADHTWEAFKENPKQYLNSKSNTYSFKGNANGSRQFSAKVFNDGTGLSISVDGYYGNGEDDQLGILAYLSEMDGELHLAAYAGESLEYPTHILSLEPAKLNLLPTHDRQQTLST
jgi:hypothetical protein